MNNIDKLKKAGKLSEIRVFIGASNSKDDSFDEEINQLDNSELIELWFRYKLGDGSWWTDAKDWFDEMERLDNSTPKLPEVQDGN